MNFQPPDIPPRACPETGYECDCNGECNMTPQQKDLILNALRIGDHSTITLYMQVDTKSEELALVRNQTLIHAAIKELEAMPTEEVK